MQRNSDVPPLIAHVVFRFDYGGLENGIVNIINSMPADRYRHAVLCLDGFGGDFRRRLKSAHTEVVSVDKKPGKDLPVYGRMWHQIRRLQPTIVHTRNLGTIDAQWVAAAAGVPFRVHGEHGWSPADPKGLVRGNLRIRRACRPVIHRYVAMSKDIEQWLVRSVHAPRARIRQIYNGVDSERFCPEGPVPADLPWVRSLGGETERPLVIGTVGRLDPIKNQGTLLGVFARILDQNLELRQRLRLIIAGDGPEWHRLHVVAQDLGISDRVWFAGARQDIPELMRAMDVFVLPSVNEGISNTILEAMATGLPVVAAKVGGNAELVADGVTGVLYESFESIGLHTAIWGYLNDADLREAHGTAGRARVVEQFSLDAMVSQYVRLYDELRSPSPTPVGESDGEGTLN